MVLIRELAEKADNMFDLPSEEIVNSQMSGPKPSSLALRGAEVVEDGTGQVQHLEGRNGDRVHARFPVVK